MTTLIVKKDLAAGRNYFSVGEEVELVRRNPNRVVLAETEVSVTEQQLYEHFELPPAQIVVRRIISHLALVPGAMYWGRTLEGDIKILRNADNRLQFAFEPASVTHETMWLRFADIYAWEFI